MHLGKLRRSNAKPGVSSASKCPTRFASSVKFEKFRPRQTQESECDSLRRRTVTPRGSLGRGVWPDRSLCLHCKHPIGKTLKNIERLDHTGSRLHARGRPRELLRRQPMQGCSRCSSAQEKHWDADHVPPSPPPQKQSRRTPDRGDQVHGPGWRHHMSTLSKTFAHVLTSLYHAMRLSGPASPVSLLTSAIRLYHIRHPFRKRTVKVKFRAPKSPNRGILLAF